MSQRGDCPMSFRDPDFFYLAVLFPWILGVLFTYRKSKESLGEVAVVRSVSGAHSFHLHPVDQNSAARSSHLNTGKERVWPGGREDEYPWGVVGLLQIYNLTSSKCVMLCYATSLQSCLTLCDPMACSPPGSLGAYPMDCSLPGSSIHGIFQAICFSRGSFQPRAWTQVSHIAGRCFTVW